MHVLSKMINSLNTNAISETLEVELYPIRCLIIKHLCVDIVRDIHANDKKFYNQYIRNNIAFKDVNDLLKNHAFRNKPSITNSIDNNKGAAILVLFLLEEFYFAWLSESNRFLMQDSPSQIEVFVKYVERIFNIKITNYIEYIPMMIRDKPPASFAFQITYILSIILPFTPNFTPLISTHIENLITHYTINQNFNIACDFDESYARKCIAHTAIRFHMYDSLPQTILNMPFSVDPIKFTTMIMYIWVDYNPFAIKQCNNFIIQMYSACEKKLTECKDKKEEIELARRKYKIVYMHQEFKYSDITNYITEYL